ncbi:dephospho-CoA kinase [Lewinella marina]|uniref:Dephospho-CoA kinase n=1 Tax=Neolewinella marina TaxID=438751 RepID=A0A2G0CHZ9_9BACT|nr:dephospho-CoA kinase [Neolewinella marina]NJB85281.1 dephospho-CoA kinase [Neolewinella marina]PHK99596.1 dephospho-CoA kinase [Neolewinella marina]
MAKRIGITGNIGAGKTTVCGEFERLGVPVYYADERAKQLMVTDQELRGAILERFGAESYRVDGTVNRPYLAQRVFGDPAALAELNALVHPAVARDATRWHAEQRGPYTLHEAAILLEIGAQQKYEAMVVVDCPYPVRLARVVARDGISPEAFAARAAQQWSDDRKRAAADHVIINDGRHLILPQVLGLDRIFRSGAAPKLTARR